MLTGALASCPSVCRDLVSPYKELLGSIFHAVTAVTANAHKLAGATTAPPSESKLEADRPPTLADVVLAMRKLVEVQAMPSTGDVACLVSYLCADLEPAPSSDKTSAATADSQPAEAVAGGSLGAGPDMGKSSSGSSQEGESKSPPLQTEPRRPSMSPTAPSFTPSAEGSSSTTAVPALGGGVASTASSSSSSGGTQASTAASSSTFTFSFGSLPPAPTASATGLPGSSTFSFGAGPGFGPRFGPSPFTLSSATAAPPPSLPSFPPMPTWSAAKPASPPTTNNPPPLPAANQAVAAVGGGGRTQRERVRKVVAKRPTAPSGSGPSTTVVVAESGKSSLRLPCTSHILPHR